MSEKFYAPKNLEELMQALKEKDENTYIVAGGTDLVVHFAKGSVFNYGLIDVSHADFMREISETEHEVVIGAACTMTEIHQSELVNKHFRALAQAAFNLGSEQIRNRATIGGNIANASQSADTLPVLFGYGASVVTINAKGEFLTRKVEEIVIGLEKTVLTSDEAVIKVIIPKTSYSSAFAKIGSRKSVTISKLNCSVMTKTEGKIISEAIVYFGAVGAKALRGQMVEKVLLGRSIDAPMDKGLEDVIREQIVSFIPNRDSRFYKKEAAIGIIDDALTCIRVNG